MELLRVLKSQSGIRPLVLVAMTVLSALATVVVVATISAAAEVAAKGSVSLRQAGLFLVATAIYALVQHTLMASFAREVEDIIHRLRLSLFAGIRASDLILVKRLGRAPLFAAITQSTQTISRNLPLVVIGSQQLVLVVLICVYMAFLSLTAFAFAGVFSAVIVWLHLARMKVLGDDMEAVVKDEGRLFAGLGAVIDGQKEIRLSKARSDAMVDELGMISSEVRLSKSQLKARWAREFALIQLAFYALVGLMVFVVPLLTTGFHEVAFKGTMAALFLIGPVGTVATAIPAIDEAERAMLAIRAVQSSLLDALGTQPEASEDIGFAQPPQAIALQSVLFTYRNPNGEPSFTLGPMTARFEAGTLTFITGGNGAGKSTLMQLLMALMPLQSGSLLYNGQIVMPRQRQAWRDCIAVVFSDFHLFTRLYGVSEQDVPRAQMLLARLEMQGKVQVRDGTFTTQDLSAGQRKRLALVSALLEDKPVLILDEWAADQDPHFRKIFYEELLPALRDEGRIVICVTHDDRWFGVADQVLHLNEGRLESRAAT